MTWFLIIMETIIWTTVLDIEAGARIRRRQREAVLRALLKEGEAR